MTGKVSGNFAHKFRRDHNLNVYDWLKKYGFRMVEGVLECMRGGYLERCLGRVDIVIRAVVQSYTQVHDRMSNQNAFIKCLPDPLFNGGDVLTGNGAADYLIYELKSRAPRQRFNPDMHLSVLPMTACLFFVLILRLCFGGNGFFVWYL